MRNVKRAISLLLVIAMLAFVGCGGTETAGTSTDSGEEKVFDLTAWRRTMRFTSP